MPTCTLTPADPSDHADQHEFILDRSRYFADALLRQPGLKQLRSEWLAAPDGTSPEKLHPATRILMEQAALLPTSARPPRSQTKTVLTTLHRIAVSLDWLCQQDRLQQRQSATYSREILAVVHPLYLHEPTADWRRIEVMLQSSTLEHIVWRATTAAIGPDLDASLGPQGSMADRRESVRERWAVDLWAAAEQLAEAFDLSLKLEFDFDAALQLVIDQFDSDSRYVQIPGQCGLGPVDWPAVSQAMHRLASTISPTMVSSEDAAVDGGSSPGTEFEIRDAADPQAAAAVVKLLRSCDEHSELTLVSIAAYEPEPLESRNHDGLSPWQRSLLQHVQADEGVHVDFGCVDSGCRLHLLVRCDDHGSQARAWRRLLDAATASLQQDGLGTSLAAALVHICQPTRVEHLQQLFDMTDRTLSASIRPGVNNVKSLSMM